MEEKRVVDLDKRIKDYKKVLSNLRFFDDLMTNIFEANIDAFKLNDVEALRESLKFEKEYKDIKNSNGGTNYCFIRNGKEVSYKEAMKYLKESIIEACFQKWSDYGIFGYIVDRFIGFFDWVEKEEIEFLKIMDH